MKRFEGNPEGLIEHLRGLMPKDDVVDVTAEEVVEEAEEAVEAEETTSDASEEPVDALAGELEEEQEEQPKEPKTIDEYFDAIKDHWKYTDEIIAKLKKKYAGKDADLMKALKNNYQVMKDREAAAAKAEQEEAKKQAAAKPKEEKKAPVEEETEQPYSF